jgi:3-phenylpropionate/trans-cinnamate dioxygenase ferredoxin subunit
VPRHFVAKAADLAPGQRLLVTLDGRTIGVFNVNGEYYALLNRCSHQGGPLCLGSLVGLAESSGPGEYRWARQGEIIRCPWHAWEFEIRTGRAIVDPHKVRVKTYPVTVEPYVPPNVETYPVTVESGWLVVHL